MPHKGMRRGTRLAALTLEICAAGRSRLAAAQEDAKPDDASFSRIFSAGWPRRAERLDRIAANAKLTKAFDINT